MKTIYFVFIALIIIPGVGHAGYGYICEKNEMVKFEYFYGAFTEVNDRLKQPNTLVYQNVSRELTQLLDEQCPGANDPVALREVLNQSFSKCRGSCIDQAEEFHSMTKIDKDSKITELRTECLDVCRTSYSEQSKFLVGYEAGYNKCTATYGNAQKPGSPQSTSGGSTN